MRASIHLIHNSFIAIIHSLNSLEPPLRNFFKLRYTWASLITPKQNGCVSVFFFLNVYLQSQYQKHPPINSGGTAAI